MGVDYRIEIRRKTDRKLLGVVDANCLKIIMDSGLEDKMHLDGRSCVDHEFTYEEVLACSDAVQSKIKDHYREIFEKKLMILAAANVEVKHELEDDIRYLEDDIEELMNVVTACGRLGGLIDCVAESLHMTATNDTSKDSETIPAYIFNGLDLPKKKVTYGDGTESEQSVYVWNDDVICIVKADY